MQKRNSMKGLQEKYKKEIIPAMIKKHGYKNRMDVPKIRKVVLNIGFGGRVAGKTPKEREKIAENIAQHLSLIAGQKPILTRSRKSISTFKIRKGMQIGAKVTLRGKKMYHFVDRLINVALPRSRDFRGIETKNVDQGGNLTIGIKEHIIFPEVSTEKMQNIFGFQVIVETTAETKNQAVVFLKEMGFPIKISKE